MVKRFLFLILLILFLPFFVQATDILTLPTIPIARVMRRLGDVLFYILVLLAFVFVLWGGINFVTASGDPNKIETAKKMVIFSLIGIVIGAVAFGIVNLIYSYLAGR